MRFYVPEWNDAVDAHYDFIHDEHSTLRKRDRERSFIWDIFDKKSLPIDGVLISREQVEESPRKFERLTSGGVYEDPVLSIPRWLPTISDCGAWGYKALPFPPYSNQGMLEFYESLDVDIGVTIDHLVLGSGKEQGRLYLDKRAFDTEFDVEDLPETLSEQVDIMVEQWPDSWPQFVTEYEPSITGGSRVQPFSATDFEGSISAILDRLATDPRAVYRDDDKNFRYELTMENAREMRELYERDEWSFRLMAAFQGWDAQSYSEAVSEILDMGYQYVGIGGVAGSSAKTVREIVSEVGGVITEYQETHQTRIDAHVFGFAKSDAFDTVGRSGITSFDSASMLRAAWTGGKNYHLDSEHRYDAIRVRYPQPGDKLEVSIEKALQGQELLSALRAFGSTESIATAIQEWHATAKTALDALPAFLREHRHDQRYDQRRLLDVRGEFRDHFEYGRALSASFGQDFRRSIIQLLREDNEGSPVQFTQYEDAITTAQDMLDTFPRTAADVAELEEGEGEMGTFRQVWPVVADYAKSDIIDDADLLDGYRRTLRARPWDRCNCPLCADYGIEVAIFRGNNRNRRRGFHNTRRFYDEFERDLPKIAAVVLPDSAFFQQQRVERYLKANHEAFWNTVHDLPVIEIGVCDANGFYEWWESSPGSVSLDPDGIITVLSEKATRYDSIYVLGTPQRDINNQSNIITVDTPQQLREQVLSQLGYNEGFAPRSDVQISLGEF